MVENGVLLMKKNEGTPLIYDAVKPFSEGLAAVQKNHKWGFINKEQEIEIEFKYERVRSFSEGLAAVRIEGKWGVINRKGTWVIFPSFDYIKDFKEGITIVAAIKEGTTPYMEDETEDNRYFFEQKVDYEWCEGLEGFQVIDEKGTLITSTTYDYISHFDSGLACVGNDRKYGFLDKNGVVVIPIQFYGARPFSEGLAVVLFLYNLIKQKHSRME